nr:uncharacterized protein LOC128704931 [Cherax quadricarinatus]
MTTLKEGTDDNLIGWVGMKPSTGAFSSRLRMRSKNIVFFNLPVGEKLHVRICLPVPLYHCFGCVGGVIAGALYGATCVLPSEAFDPEVCLQVIQDERASSCYGTPTMFVDILNVQRRKPRDVSSLSAGVMAGAPCPRELVMAVMNELNMKGLTLVYGMTETSPVTFQCFQSDSPQVRSSTVGYPGEHIETNIYIYHSGSYKFGDLYGAGDSCHKTMLADIATRVKFDDPFNIQFTSGTTGLPKAAVLTHHMVINNAYSTGRRADYDKSHVRICLPVPLYHCFGCVGGVIAGALYGATCVLPSEAFDPEVCLQVIQDERASSCYGTPTMFVDILNVQRRKPRDISSLSTGVMAGAPCPQELVMAVMDELNMEGLTLVYGMTETSPVTFQCFQSDSPQVRSSTVGYPGEHIEFLALAALKHGLEQHLAICNAREKTGLSYMSRNINLRPGDQEEPPKTSLSSLSDQQLLSFITRVEAAHRENVGTIEESILSHHIMEKEMTRPGYGPSVVRHLSQNSSILGHLENSALLNTSITPTCFIEFGAGRGKHTIQIYLAKEVVLFVIFLSQIQYKDLQYFTIRVTQV